MLLTHSPQGLLYLSRYIGDLNGAWQGEASDIPRIFSGTMDEQIKLKFDIAGGKLEALDLRLSLETDGTIST